MKKKHNKEDVNHSNKKLDNMRENNNYNLLGNNNVLNNNKHDRDENLYETIKRNHLNWMNIDPRNQMNWINIDPSKYKQNNMYSIHNSNIAQNKSAYNNHYKDDIKQFINKFNALNLNNIIQDTNNIIDLDENVNLVENVNLDINDMDAALIPTQYNCLNSCNNDKYNIVNNLNNKKISKYKIH